MLDTVETAFWIYDFQTGRILWANRSALRLWDAPSILDLRERPLLDEMSVSVRTRLVQHREDFELEPDREIREFWTLYPEGAPFRVRATLRRFDLDDGRLAMMVEARAEEQTEPTTIRSADALLHTQVITALFDGNGQELYANPAFRAAFGPGRHRFGADFSHLGDAAAFVKGLQDTGRHRATVEVRTVDGERWHDIQAIRCRDAVTSDRAFLISAVDITEARDHQRRLQEALTAAQAADLSKAHFLSSMSHEMRTPLNGILGMAGILRASDLQEEQQWKLGVISSCGLSMLQMIEGILDLVALDDGSMILDPTDFDPAMLADMAIEQLRPEAESKGLALSIDSRHLSAGAYVNDASRVRQVLGHLLSNAVKFTDHGAIVVRLRSAIGEKGVSRLRFEVCDTGCGVPQAEHDKIFERFTQIDASATRRHGGTGLGLAICRELVALWGGEIGVSCGVTGGSTFWFDMPSRPD